MKKKVQPRVLAKMVREESCGCPCGVYHKVLILCTLCNIVDYFLHSVGYCADVFRRSRLFSVESSPYLKLGGHAVLLCSKHPGLALGYCLM